MFPLKSASSGMPIANIYARDAFSAAAAQQGLNEQSGGRFLLGLGVSHVPLVEGIRKLHYNRSNRVTRPATARTDGTGPSFRITKR
jgi:hypothetical protein